MRGGLEETEADSEVEEYDAVERQADWRAGDSTEPLPSMLLETDVDSAGGGCGVRPPQLLSVLCSSAA
jgi:hypothetical protein